jgi:hypothetical protein
MRFRRRHGTVMPTSRAQGRWHRPAISGTQASGVVTDPGFFGPPNGPDPPRATYDINIHSFSDAVEHMVTFWNRNVEALRCPE